MDLIKLIRIQNDIIQFKYYGEEETKYITNIGFTEVETFKFIRPAIGTENHSFFRIFNGNISDKNGDDISIYIIMSTNERAYYIINSDFFNNTFEKIQH